MTIELYVSTSEKERVDKTPYLTLIDSYSGFLRDTSSIVNPVIYFQLPLESISSIIDEDGEDIEDSDGVEVATEEVRVTSANYMYIPEFGRYYFINDIEVGKTGLYTISASVDVLMTYKDNILDLRCYVERNEFAFSAYEQDNLLPLRFEKRIEYAEILNFDLKNFEFKTAVSNSVALTVNTNETTAFSDHLPPAGSELPKISTSQFSAYGSSYVWRIDAGRLSYVGSALQSAQYSTFTDFIKGIVSFPFELPVDTSVLNPYGQLIYFGEYGNPSRVIDITGGIQPLTGDRVNPLSPYLVLVDTVLPFASSYLDYAPFTRTELYIPFYGWFELNMEELQGKRVLLYYTVNYEDGSGTVYLYNYDDKSMVFTSNCQMGVKISTTATNKQELEAQKTAENLNLAVGLISSAISIAGGIAAQNPVAAAMGVVAGAKSITGYINANAQMFDKSSSSFNGAAGCLYSPLKAKIRYTRTVKLIGDMSGYAHACGRPLRQMRLLSSLSGFTIAQSVHLDGITCLGGEADAIANLLASGVIL